MNEMTVSCTKKTSQSLATSDFGNWFTGHFRGSTMQIFFVGKHQGSLDISINVMNIRNFT